MTSQLKILTIVYDLDIGGTQRAAQNFAIAYQKFGFDSKMLPLYKLGVRQADLISNGVYVYPALIADKNVMKEVCSWKPDIVHIHRSGESEAIYTELFNSLPLGQVIVETNVFSFVDHTSDVKKIKAHFHLSKWCLWKWNHFSPKNSLGIVVPYLVLEDNFYSVKNSQEVLDFKSHYNIPKDCFLFGRIGQKSPAKFHPEIFRCFDRLSRENRNVHLVLVGVPDRYLEEVKQTQAYLNQKITLIDSLVGDNNLRVAYSAFDCFLHISAIGESFGMVLAESQLCETPVLTLSTPQVDNSQLEVCPHQETSIVAKNISAYYQEMQNIVEGKYELKQFGINGRNHILNNYSPKVLIPKLKLIFDILLKNQNIDDELNKIVLTNRKSININDLKKMGTGHYSLSTKIFFISPFVYLHLSAFANRLKKIVVNLK